MPNFAYSPVAPETFVSRVQNNVYSEQFWSDLNDPDISVKKVSFIVSACLAISEGDDSDTRAAIYILGQKAAYIRNTRDGQDFIYLLDRKFEETIRELLGWYESKHGYGETSIVCAYEEVEV